MQPSTMLAVIDTPAARAAATRLAANKRRGERDAAEVDGRCVTQHEAHEAFFELRPVTKLPLQLEPAVVDQVIADVLPPCVCRRRSLARSAARSSTAEAICVSSCSLRLAMRSISWRYWSRVAKSIAA